MNAPALPSDDPLDHPALIEALMRHPLLVHVGHGTLVRIHAVEAFEANAEAMRVHWSEVRRGRASRRQIKRTLQHWVIGLLWSKAMEVLVGAHTLPRLSRRHQVRLRRWHQWTHQHVWVGDRAHHALALASAEGLAQVLPYTSVPAAARRL